MSGILRRRTCHSVRWVSRTAKSAFAFEQRMVEKPRSLDDVYTRIASRPPSMRQSGEFLYASSNRDQVLTRVDTEILQIWSLYETCLESRDFERADLMLQNLATSKFGVTPHFVDGICEFLKVWGSEDSVSMDEVRSWFNHVYSLNSHHKPEARVYAWLINLSYRKGRSSKDAMSLLMEFRLLSSSNKNDDVLRYVDIIGMLNIKKMVDYTPTIADDLPENYRNLFKAVQIHSREEVAEADTSAIPQVEHATVQDNNSTIDLTADSKNVANDPKQKPTEPINEVIDNNMEELLSVSAENLKNIRHSLLGLVDSYNDGQFVKQLVQLCELEKLAIDMEQIKHDTEIGIINLFELKNKLPHEQHAKFDEILDQISESRERVLESSTFEAAKLKWEREFENLKDKALPSTVGAYLHTWLMDLKPMIEDEIKECSKAAKLLKEDGTGDVKLKREEQAQLKEKLLYAPFLEVLKSDKIATIAISDVMKHLVTSDITRGVAVSKLVIGIGKAIELEYKSEKILAVDRKIQRNFKAIKGTKEFKMFLRSSKAKEMMERAEKESLAGNELSESSLLSWDTESLCKVGSVLLSFILRVFKIEVNGTDPRTGEVQTASAPALYHTYDFVNGSKVGVIKLNQTFANKLGKDRLDQSIQAQYLPMVCRPKPWTAHNDGGYFLKRTLVLRAKNAPEQSAYVKAASQQQKMDRILQGLNNLGNTPWTVNKKMLELITNVWNTGTEFLEIPKAEDQLILPSPPPKGCDAIDVFKYRRTCTDLKNEFSKNKSMRCDMNYKLEIARAFIGERIFFPHSLDFRGRAYPIPPNFNHLGNDMSRSLLKFWTGKELGETGLKWLKIHLSNLMGKDKISLDERAQFIDDNIDEIRDSVSDPLGGNRWWMKADKPWQFLASAHELVEALELPDPTKYLSFQPVHQDGTCNGLQHYAALGGDIEGAKQVNLIPGDRPSDVYTHVSKIVTENVEKDMELGVEEAALTLPIISRKLVKQTVMTSVYGVTYVGARAQITKRLKEIEFDDDAISKCSKYLTGKVFMAIRHLFSGAHEIQDWFALAARRISKSIRTDIDFEDGQEFTSSVIWTSPLGLPVVQPYRTLKSKQVKTNMQTFVIQDPYGISNVDGRKQANGFPPNYIHSLDATHMLLSVNKCSEHNMSFSSVHDSYWTHACDVDIMNKVLREEFVRLHKNNLVEKLKGEFERRYDGFLMIAKVDKKSAVGQSVTKYRAELAKKLGKQPTLLQEVKIEVERQKLLKSQDSNDVALAKELKTCVSVLEGVDFDCNSPEHIDGTGDYQILVPFSLPEVPEKGDFDVAVVKDSPYFFS